MKSLLREKSIFVIFMIGEHDIYNSGSSASSISFDLSSMVSSSTTSHTFAFLVAIVPMPKIASKHPSDGKNALMLNCSLTNQFTDNFSPALFSEMLSRNSFKQDVARQTIPDLAHMTNTRRQTCFRNPSDHGCHSLLSYQLKKLYHFSAQRWLTQSFLSAMF